MTFSTPSDDSSQPKQLPDCTNFKLPQSFTEDTYRDFSYPLNHLGISAAYPDVSKLDFNILEVPDLSYLDAPRHTQILGKTGGGKSVLVASKLLDNLSNPLSHLKINFRPKPSH
ncbi:hypothetical protein ACSYAD_34085 [Acaryochloris marina NIES-2412]|uniref:hypothetical protein n=1 Tax=Acaryochloris marina TaxID=155978 RepID=UPI004058E0CD